MLFEIINPSDPYTLETDSYAAAVAAVCILGEGKYGLDPIGCDVPKVPLALFGDLPPHVYQAAGVKDFDEQDCARKPGQQGRIPADVWALKQFPTPRSFDV